MNIDTSTALERALAPLLDLFNRDFSTGSNENYRLQSHDPLSELELSQDQIAIVLPANITRDKLAMRAVVTLLRVTASELARVSALGSWEKPWEGTLQFSLQSQVAWDNDSWVRQHAIIVDYLGSDIDAGDAARQVGPLVTFLRTKQMLLELGAVERGLF